MEGDRAAVLTVRSAVRGIIDYREADIVDRRWWRRWRILVNEMTTQSDKELLNQLYLYHLALVSNSGLTEESFKSTQQSARENFNEFAAKIRPWLGRTAEERGKTENEQMKEDWKLVFGWDIDNEEEYDSWKSAMQELKDKGANYANEVQMEQVEREKKFSDARERIRERRARAYRSNR